MAHSIPSTVAYDALLKRIKSSETVFATFRMPSTHAVAMEINVDGEEQSFYITMRRDGTWDATFKGEI